MVYLLLYFECFFAPSPPFLLFNPNELFHAIISITHAPRFKRTRPACPRNKLPGGVRAPITVPGYYETNLGAGGRHRKAEGIQVVEKQYRAILLADASRNILDPVQLQCPDTFYPYVSCFRTLSLSSSLFPLATKWKTRLRSKPGLNISR